MHVQARQVNLTAQLQEELADAARQTLTAAAQRPEVTYSGEGVVLPSEKARVPAAYLDPESAVLSAFTSMTFALADKHDLERDFQFFAYVAGQPGAEIVFISKFNPRRGLSKKKLTRWVNNQLTEISEPVLAFDPGGADLIWVPPTDFIALNVPVFEFLLRDAPEVIARTAARATELGAAISLSSSSVGILQRAVQRDSRLRRRLDVILSRGHLAGVSIMDIEAELMAKGYDATTFITNGELDLSEANVAVALQVLNEDVLLGAFSNLRFAAERKVST